MTTESTVNNNGGLPLIPLSPIAQSYIICSNALKLATEKLAEAKKAKPAVQVGVLRGLLETSKVETHRLNSLVQKMQSTEGATALYWDPDSLARQIAVIDCQLFNQAFIDKRALSQLDIKQTKLSHLADFHHYLSHSFAHQLIYWVELTNMDTNSDTAHPVVPPVNSTKDSLVSHLIRVAYLLLHAYRDFSGFAAIMKSLMFPEVRRLNKKLWQNVSSRTKDMFRDLAQIVSPMKDYNAYQLCLRNKLDSLIASSSSPVAHHSGDGMMTVVPWIHPHLLAIRSIVTAYAAGDNEDPNLTAALGDVIVLSVPGVHKLDLEVALLEICQHNSCSNDDFGLDDILSANGIFQLSKKKPLGTSISKKRSSILTNSSSNSNSNHHLKAIHIEGLRTAVMPLVNLNNLAPGEQLIHHWLVSRVYLRKDQLINESIEVQPLKVGETVIGDPDEFEELSAYPKTLSKPSIQQANSNDASLSSLQSENITEPEPDLASPLQSSPINKTDDFVEQELVNMPHSTKKLDRSAQDQDYTSFISHKAFASLPKKEAARNIRDDDDSNDNDDDDNENDNDNGDQVVTLEVKDSIEKVSTNQVPVEYVEAIEQTEATLSQTTDTNEPLDRVIDHVQHQKENESREMELKEITTEETVLESEERKMKDLTAELKTLASSTASNSTTTSDSSSKRQKSKLSPSAPEFIPSSKKTESVTTSTTNEKWLGYPVRKEEEAASAVSTSNKRSETSEEKWAGYLTSSPNTDKEQKTGRNNSDDDDEVWKGYPGPNSSSIDSPRRASSQSETSEEWKGYHATKMEADWQRESALKVQEHEWQGYTLETLDEDELDSSTMMDGEFEKSRKARGQHGKHNDQILENFQRKKRV